MIRRLIHEMTAPKLEPYHWLDNKLQFILLTMVETQSLEQIQEKYFNDSGIGYLKRVMAGRAQPHELLMNAYLARVPLYYHDLYDKYVEYEKSFKGW